VSRTSPLGSGRSEQNVDDSSEDKEKAVDNRT
jgi:hypothetical protein